ncbi:MAG TPA: threonine/serine exporter family protein [Candidatus Anaerostipes avicola]|uniref:threonine/serine exporter family protein n=1 Tax=Anaerostipes TaxID=207244 RepID=UPI001F911268|nr:threonine/serine exporter family protein [Anaerostipes sp.]HJC83878.1 threonine/serine exporter family protein [Candidatus Anaerostipes avicola]
MEMKQVLVTAVDIGACLLVSGGGVSRVEDTINRICRAYGAKETDVFSITSSIVASVRDDSGEVYTRTKRIKEYHTDFTKLDQLNQLSRYICENQPDLQEVRKRLKKIEQGDGQSLEKRTLVSAVIAASFTVFFGGGWQESLAAFVIGGLVMLFREYMKKFLINRMFLDFLSAFLVASAAYGISKTGSALGYGEVIIGNIMLLVPGVAFVNGLRDMISGDTMSGILTVCESVILAVFLAGGSFAAIVLWGGVI